MSRGNGRHSATLGSVTRSAIDGATGVNSNSFYDCKSGVSISVILALTLAWIPYIGPIVSGFVGGRRAGSILRGMFVGVLSSIIIFVIASLLGLGLVKLFEPEYQSFIDTVDGFAPFIVDGLEMFTTYLSTNFVVVTSNMSLSLVPQTYASIISFAIIGGVFADQARKELRIIVSQSMEANKPKPRRSTSAFLSGRDLGFQTYGDLSRMNVNAVGASMVNDSPVNEPVSEPVPIVPEPVDVDVVSTESVTPVASIHDVTSAVSEDVPDSDEKAESASDMQDSGSTVPEKPKVSDDMDWL